MSGKDCSWAAYTQGEDWPVTGTAGADQKRNAIVGCVSVRDEARNLLLIVPGQGPLESGTHSLDI